MRAHKSVARRSSEAALLALTAPSVLLVLGLSGCSANGNNATSSTGASATVTSSGAQLDIGNTINYGSFGTTTEIDCSNGKSLNVGGSSNTLTVKGTCGSVSVGGADNKIILDKIDGQLHVVGFNNTITYKDGNPTVNNVGANNAINKG
jgi:hypothetical protein